MVWILRVICLSWCLPIRNGVQHIFSFGVIVEILIVLVLDDTSLLNSSDFPALLFWLFRCRVAYIPSLLGRKSSWIFKIDFVHQLFPRGFQANFFARHVSIIHVNCSQKIKFSLHR